MDIKEFFELSAGKWFAQRTCYDLAGQQAESGKSDLIVELLPSDAPEIVQLCQQKAIDPSLTWGGMKVSWDTSVDWGKTKQIGSALLAVIPDADNPKIGQLLRSSSNLKEQPLTGRYLLGNDESLTLTAQGKTTYTEERLWFASPNLRLRTSIVKQNDRFSASAFYSEIRRVPPKSE